MKKTITTISMALLLCISAIVLNGCKGKDGVAGTPGATGPQGNANVQSKTFAIASWTYYAPQFMYYANMNWSVITQDILDHGAVLVYQTDNVTTSTGNLQLPYTWYPTATYSETWLAQAAIGNAQVQIIDSDLTQPANPGSSLIFKVVVMTDRMMLTNPHINFKDYESVRNAFHLRD